MAFRFIHAADTHIDSPMRGLDAYQDAPLDALRDAQRGAFTRLVDLALEERADFLLLAGDIYDGDWKDWTTGMFFCREMARLGRAGIPVYLVSGNHDAESLITRQLPLPDNVQRLPTDAPATLEVAGLPVAIHGQGFATRAVVDNLAAGYPAPLPGRFNIGLLHTALAGAEGHEPYAPCTPAELAAKGYDYWALGHVHRPQVVQRDPWIVYPGNLQGRHVGETGPRGAVLVSVGEAFGVALEWRYLDTARWAHLQVDLRGVEAPEAVDRRVLEALRAAHAEVGGRLLAARVTLSGATPLHDTLHHAPDALRARVIALAQQLDADTIWIEEVRLATAPCYTLEALKARDDLTRIVLESLEAAAHGELALPDEARAMLDRLPDPEVRPALLAELAEANRAALLDDVRAILLEALRATGEGRA